MFQINVIIIIVIRNHTYYTYVLHLDGGLDLSTGRGTFIGVILEQQPIFSTLFARGQE